MPRHSTARRASRAVAMAAHFRATFHQHHDHRLRGGTIFSAAAIAGAAGSLGDPSGGGTGQARHQTAPAAGRRGGEGRGCEYPSTAARQALHRVSELLATILIMGWPMLVIGLVLANPSPAGVFAYIMDPREMVRGPTCLFDLPYPDNAKVGQ